MTKRLLKQHFRKELFSQKASASAGTLISFVTLDLVRFYHGPEN
jgi:hypothetical protein